jgi:hypothetical protein
MEEEISKVQQEAHESAVGWQDKVLGVDRAWNGSTYVLNVLNSWAAAAIRSSTSAILRWDIDRAKLEEKITQHCR